MNYLFLKDPVEFLFSRHHGLTIMLYHVYLSQCRKSNLVKEGRRKVLKDLVDYKPLRENRYVGDLLSGMSKSKLLKNY